MKVFFQHSDYITLYLSQKKFTIHDLFSVVILYLRKLPQHIYGKKF